MTIVFDARCITPTASGTSVYVRELLRRLPALAPAWTWHVLFQDEATRRAVLDDALPGGRANVASSLLPYSFSSLLGKAKLTRLLRRQGCDLYFSPIVANSFLAFKFLGTCRAVVVTVHSNPARDTVSAYWSLLKRWCLDRAARNCAAVITVSQALRDDIVKSRGLSEKAAARLKVVYSGVSPAFSPAERPPEQGKTRVILYVGNQRRYKNLPVLIRAFAEVRRRGGDLHLLLVGPESDHPAPLRNLVHNLGLDAHVTFAGETTEPDLVAAYREAALLVNPSGYEGFNLPLLEAMACGTPIVCCEGGAVRELVGDVYDPIPADDASALEVAMERMLTDEALRTRTVQAGLARAAAFTWDRTARQTLDIFAEALATTRRRAP